MGDEYAKLRVAVVQAAPVFLQREASVEKACRLIREAGAQGARVIGFPEGFIPAHPVWYHFHPATSDYSLRLAAELFKNSVEIPSSATDALGQAARAANAYVVIGVCEKLPGTTGTMYNTQLYLDPSGRVIGKHQKVQPTVGERLVHTGGHGDTMRAFGTEFGPISGLICGENSNPLAVFTLAAESTRIHVASWPHHFPRTYKDLTMGQVAVHAGWNIAYVCKAYVLNACGVLDAEMKQALAANDADRAFLDQPEVSGGSTIIGPDGRIIAGPLGPEEGILYADVDLEEAVRGKLVHDFAGHYNRADVFQLRLNVSAPPLLQPVGSTQPEPAALGRTWLRDLSADASDGQRAVEAPMRGPALPGETG
ncbi:MAG: carbon-nitrogen hydrolase family protein [Chloroflexi bacterium]|nr:carbon-nitrogen hydrolase family protein [Chloroflexota bacterium]